MGGVAVVQEEGKCYRIPRSHIATWFSDPSTRSDYVVPVQDGDKIMSHLGEVSAYAHLDEAGWEGWVP